MQEYDYVERRTVEIPVYGNILDAREYFYDVWLQADHWRHNEMLHGRPEPYLNEDTVIPFPKEKMVRNEKWA